MKFTSWIESVDRSLKRGLRRKGERHNYAALATEALEDRSLMSASALFVAGELDIELGSADNVAVRENPASPGTVQVLLNGVPLANVASLTTGSIEKILINGGDDANLIDLTGVTASAFTNPLLTIEVHAFNGDDILLGSNDFGDILDGGDGNDSIDGNGGNDTLRGGNGNDAISGGTGNDSIEGSDGQDAINGNGGDDTVLAGNGQDLVDGGAGNDSLSGDDGADTMLGGDGNDTLNGMAGSDSLDGQVGDDLIFGGTGDDTLSGNLGNDTLDGQAGLDSLLGSDGNDLLIGGDGNDSLAGEAGNDTLNGSANNDTLDGGDGDDSLLGGAGNDALSGSAGNDTVRGQAGNDTVRGGAGADQLNGDAGDDVIEGGEAFISVDDVTLTEGNGGVTNAVFTVTLSFVSQQTVSVTFSTTDGTATAGSDYTAVNTVVTFAPGVTTQTVNVPVLGDTTIEPDETFLVNLTNAANATIFDGVGQGAILDDDNPAPDVSIGLNFTGATINDTQGFIPPDTMGTVGPNHIVEMLNGVFTIYNKTTGAVLQRMFLDQFWANTGVAGPLGTFDSRIVFDPTSGRYFASSENQGPGPNGEGNSIFIAVSISNDPTAGFRGVRFVADSSGQFFDDYPTMSIDADGMYFATNNFGNTFDVSIFSIPKADLLLPVPSVANMSRFENLNANLFGDSIQAALDFGPSDGRAALLSVASGNTLVRTNIIGAGGPGATLQAPTNITIPAFQPAPDGDQPGGASPLENVTPRFTGNVFEIGNSMWAVHTVLDNATGNSAIRWYEIDEVTNAVLQTGTFADPALDFLDPSIAVNAAGAVVIGATGTGLNQFPSTYAFVGQTTAGVTSFGTAMLLHAGTASQNFGGRNRWGDYSATVIDPSNPNAFWTFQEYSSGPTTWAIQITQLLVVPAAPPPPPPPPPFVSTGDTLNGGDGNDTLFGSDGDDVISGNGGNDSLVGAGGNDSILGGSGSDILDGGTGDDTLRGQGGADTMNGGDGNDVFEWDANFDGDDIVSSSNGDDRMTVTTGATVDVIAVGKVGSKMKVTLGANQLIINPTIRLVTIDTGAGNDTVTVGDISGVTATVLTINGGLGDDNLNASTGVLGNVRMGINGNDGNDSITGSVSDDTLDGGTGTDTLLGGAGNDTLFGGTEGDAINGQAGNDFIRGDDGNDTLDGGAGNDLMRGGLGHDTMSGNEGNDTLEGNDGRDTLVGGIGNDSLDSGLGRDSLLGGDGNDTIDGGQNDDTVFGEAGADSIRGGDGPDSIDGGLGLDTINGGQGNDTISSGDDADLVAGGDGDDLINAGMGSDSVTGGDGRDTIYGGGGNDALLGNDGDDVINGQSGIDTISGGEGADTLIGDVSEFNERFVLISDLLKKLGLI